MKFLFVSEALIPGRRGPTAFSVPVVVLPGYVETRCRTRAVGAALESLRSDERMGPSSTGQQNGQAHFSSQMPRTRHMLVAPGTGGKQTTELQSVRTEAMGSVVCSLL